ncbi:MAG TPA: DUF1580 domain-containing protein [Gemmataceae bacterium]|jgi:hypothetical protein
MAIDPLNETLRSFAEAARRLPALRGGKPVNTSTVWRWTKRGVRARNGAHVRLESLKVGGTCCTSDQALLRFFQALSEDDSSPPAPSPAPLQQDEASEPD